MGVLLSQAVNCHVLLLSVPRCHVPGTFIAKAGAHPLQALAWRMLHMSAVSMQLRHLPGQACTKMPSLSNAYMCRPQLATGVQTPAAARQPRASELQRASSGRGMSGRGQGSPTRVPLQPRRVAIGEESLQ